MDEEKYLTKEGLAKLKQELEERKTFRRLKIKNRIEEAIKLGDLSENAEYHEAKDDQGMNEARIRELENLIKNAKIVSDFKEKKCIIGIGCTVKAKVYRQEKEFTIVGASEADPSLGLISNESPLGKVFIGKRVGDIVEVDAPAGKIKYKIISID